MPFDIYSRSGYSITNVDCVISVLPRNPAILVEVPGTERNNIRNRINTRQRLPTIICSLIQSSDLVNNTNPL